ncbi:MAG TPA: MotA/TolQ/ExbB proton channel family protein [Pirellulales bacterium]
MRADRLRTQIFGLCAALLAAVAVGAQQSSVLAQTPAAQKPPAAAAAPAGHGFIDIVLAGGFVGHTIIVLSIVALALAIDQAWKIRAAVLMPPGLADKVRGYLQAGQLAQAQQQCKLQSSVLASVLAAGLSEIDAGWPAAEKAMEDMVAEHSARLFRRIEYLSVIGNIAPMLGLLGTVIGMVVAFRQVAVTQGAARAADLAEGIYLALVTTVEGLIVAIPCLGVFAILRNRVDELIAEVAYTAQHAFSPLRHGRAAAPRRASPLPPPVEGRA